MSEKQSQSPRNEQTGRESKKLPRNLHKEDMGGQKCHADKMSKQGGIDGLQLTKEKGYQLRKRAWSTSEKGYQTSRPLVGGIGFEPRFKIPDLVCYHYTIPPIRLESCKHLDEKSIDRMIVEIIRSYEFPVEARS